MVGYHLGINPVLQLFFGSIVTANNGSIVDGCSFLCCNLNDILLKSGCFIGKNVGKMFTGVVLRGVVLP